MSALILLLLAAAAFSVRITEVTVTGNSRVTSEEVLNRSRLEKEKLCERCSCGLQIPIWSC